MWEALFPEHRTITRLCRIYETVWWASRQNTGTTVDHSIERRTSRRFQIALSVLFRWADSVEHYDGGFCVNIGQGGMFVLADQTPPAGVEVQVELVLPPFGSVQRPTRFHCIGRVSRVEACYQLTGFAVAGQFVGELPGTNHAPCASVSQRSDMGR
jgi:hypothetical protein